jgi:hypothetical protein
MAYTPGQVYTAPSTIGVSTSPTAGYKPIAGETLYASWTKRVSLGSFPGRPGYAPSSVEANPKVFAHPNILTIEAVRAEIFGMSEDELRELQKKLGVKPTGFADPNTVDVVDAFLSHVSDINAAGVTKTWMQVLNQETDSGKTSWVDAMNGGSDAAEEPFTGTKTQTDTRVVTLSPSEVRGMAEAAFVAAIGREPTKSERRALRGKLNDMARANPVITKTTGTFEEGDLMGTDTVVNGGVNMDQKVLNAARSEEGFAEYQAINYFDTMMSALGTPGGV